MLGGRCCHWTKVPDFVNPELEYFSLPAPIPQWPQGEGFACGTVSLGEIEVRQITKFEFIWGCDLSQNKRLGVSFYKPVGIPNGYYCLGHYSQFNDKPLKGFVLVAREVARPDQPALRKPLDYTLVWSSDDGIEEYLYGYGYFWLPVPPNGYRALGFIVTNKPGKPELEEVRCVRADLTEQSEAYRLLFSMNSRISPSVCEVWNTRPHNRGMREKGVSVGTFFCSSYWNQGEDLTISCLKNLNADLHAMPNLSQIHALIRHYGPTMFFHPNEIYLPSSVSWFFENGALLYRKGESVCENINTDGSNLPAGGRNDDEYWIDLPNHDDRGENIKHGNVKSAELYVHVKPALGGTFTDIVMWVFCPFNGPGTLKIGIINIPLSKVGQHVGDWEHFTLRISNFTGELFSVYFSQHSGGQWVDVTDLEFIEGNKAAVYSSRNGHASFPHPGTYIQGSPKLGVGVRNDATRSGYYIDSSKQYEIVSAEYLGDGVVTEPSWLQYMRKWGPTIEYDSRTVLNKIMNRLPVMLRYSMESISKIIPLEFYGEEGPTGPKEKNNWFGDERW